VADLKRLAQALRARRVELNLSQSQVASRVGLSRTMISRFERAIDKPKPGILEALARVLELSPHLLFRVASAERHVINPHARADNPLSVVFDLSEFSEVQIADLIASLSRLYVAEGGHGLIIDRIHGLTSTEPRVGGDQ
jgi:transcriptional regulator with XRE-family HTH domain